MFRLSIIGSLIAGPVLAGDLNPPPGPPAPTFKTLTEVEPRRAVFDNGGAPISLQVPGEYFLAENIFATGNAIEIRAGGITLDLNGFDVRGDLNGTSDFGILVTVSASQTFRVKNGAIRNFEGAGIRSEDTIVPVIVEEIRVDRCGLGIDLDGPGVIRRCLVQNSTSNGFRLDGRATLDSCIALDNGGDGFFLGGRSLLTRCTAHDNGFDGFIMTANADASRLSECLASGNGDDGFQSSSANVSWLGCTAYDNMGSGFSSLAWSTMINCDARVNGENGFSAMRGSQLTNCSANSNGVDGFNLFGTTVVSCDASSNTGDGFELSSGSRATFCNASNNDGVGFLAGDDTLVESCVATSNNLGFQGVAGAAFIRNFHFGTGGAFTFNGADGFVTGSLSPTAGAWSNFAF